MKRYKYGYEVQLLNDVMGEWSELAYNMSLADAQMLLNRLSARGVQARVVCQLTSGQRAVVRQ